VSIVRENLLTRLHYTPYCGNGDCRLRMPRATFDGEQFACPCGWRSKFEPEFIERYKAAQAALARVAAADLAVVVAAREVMDAAPVPTENRMVWPPTDGVLIRCKGCDLANGCPEYCRCAPGVLVGIDPGSAEGDHSVTLHWCEQCGEHAAPGLCRRKRGHERSAGCVADGAAS
jgi:hypothetical protein